MHPRVSARGRTGTEAMTVAWHSLHMGGILVKRYSLVPLKAPLQVPTTAVCQSMSVLWFLLRVIF